MGKNSKKSGFGYSILVYLLMTACVIFVIFVSIYGQNETFWYKLVLGFIILAAVIIMDFVEPMATGKLAGMKSIKVQAYVSYAIADAAAYTFLYLFVININMYREPFHYVFLAAAFILILLKAALYKKFKSISDGVRRKYKRPTEAEAESDARVGSVIYEVGDDEIRTIRYRNQYQNSYKNPYKRNK